MRSMNRAKGTDNIKCQASSGAVPKKVLKAAISLIQASKSSSKPIPTKTSQFVKRPTAIRLWVLQMITSAT